VDPAPGALSAHEGRVADLLASHPPIRQRIIRLRGMGYQQAKRLGETAPQDTGSVEPAPAPSSTAPPA
jgi:hypothetical protein